MSDDACKSWLNVYIGLAWGILTCNKTGEHTQHSARAVLKKTGEEKLIMVVVVWQDMPDPAQNQKGVTENG